MIFVRDKGRMCNNILQYGHVYAWAREHGRRTLSMRFCYKYQYFKICFTKYHNTLIYIAIKCAGILGLLPVASFDWDKDITNETRMLEQKKNLIVEGWAIRFYGLFIKYIDEIKDLFAFNDDIRKRVESLIRTTAPQADILLGVHIRRGDYKTWHNGKYYFDDNVYVDRIRQFTNLYPGKRITVYICGNDPSLDKKFYLDNLKALNVFFPEGNPGEDLCLLSNCDYLIGAPSTFSLVASMYKDIPLYWIEEEVNTLRKDSFSHFEVLFKTV